MSGLASYVAFALPLGTDSAAVTTAYGASTSTTWRRRLAVCGTLTAFEAGMPGVGMLLAGPVGHMIGDTAHYFAALLLVGLGVWMLVGDDDDGPSLDGRALLAVGVAVSIDEIAVGVGLGLHGASWPALAGCIAVWVGAATLTGISLGARVPARFHPVAGVAAAVMLCVLGIGIGLDVL